MDGGHQERDPGDFIIGKIHQPPANQRFIEKIEAIGECGGLDADTGGFRQIIKFGQPVFCQQLKYGQATLTAKKLFFAAENPLPA